MEEKSLKDLCQEVLNEKFNKKGHKKSLNEIIVSDKLSAEFIREELQDQELDIPVDNSSDLYQIAVSRARHSVVTYLMGKVFMKFLSFQGEICKMCDNYRKETVDEWWMLTSLYHDSGYYSEYVKKENFDFEKEFKGEYLLSDEHQLNGEKSDKVLSYYIAEIKNYERYKSEKYSKDNPKNEEKVDHGILGGCITYRNLLRRSRKKSIEISELELLKIKTVCLTIVQHNIFKSSDENTDKIYREYNLQRLQQNSEHKISMRTPLLLLLCLVDTVECVKKLSRGETEKKYLETLTVLDSINVSVERNLLSIDFGKLKKKCEEKHDGDMMRIFNKHMDAIFSLSNWTNLVAQKNDMKFTIEYQ